MERMNYADILSWPKAKIATLYALVDFFENEKDALNRNKLCKHLEKLVISNKLPILRKAPAPASVYHYVKLLTKEGLVLTAVDLEKGGVVLKPSNEAIKISRLIDKFTKDCVRNYKCIMEFSTPRNNKVAENFYKLEATISYDSIISGEMHFLCLRSSKDKIKITETVEGLHWFPYDPSLPKTDRTTYDIHDLKINNNRVSDSVRTQKTAKNKYEIIYKLSNFPNYGNVNYSISTYHDRKKQRTAISVLDLTDIFEVVLNYQETDIYDVDIINQTTSKNVDFKNDLKNKEAHVIVEDLVFGQSGIVLEWK
ncbi:hypothetical protein ACFLQ6_01530 [Thermoproteota archaeon]